MSIVACSSLITACGGSGGSSETSPTQSTASISQAPPLTSGSSSQLPVSTAEDNADSEANSAQPQDTSVALNINREQLSETVTAEPSLYRLGAQVSKISSDMTAWAFSDVFKTAGLTGQPLADNPHGWFFSKAGIWSTAQSHKIQVDKNGWPTSMALSDGTRADTIFTTVMSAEIDTAYEAGEYALTYAGEGEFEFTNATVVEQSPGEIILQYAGYGALTIAITTTDPQGSGDYLRNIQLMRPGASAANLFTQSYLNYLKPAKVIRPTNWFSDAALYNRVSDTAFTRFDSQGWAERATLDNSNWGAAKGAPYELMIELANRSASHLWLNVPLTADNTYIEQLARLLHDGLNTNKVLYLELGNELTKRTYPQRLGREYAVAQAELRWPEARNTELMQGRSALEQENLLISNWQAARTLEIKQRFATIWGDDMARVVTVLAGTVQDSGNLTTYNQMLLEGALLAEFEGSQAPGDWADTLAVDPMVVNTAGTQLSIDSASAMLADAQNFVEGTDRFYAQADTPGLRYGIRQAAELTRQYGIALTAYAGGHDFNASSYLNFQVLKSAQMYDLYQAVFEVWEEENGGMFIAGKGITSASLPAYCASATYVRADQVASIGLKETQMQDEQDAHMYRAWRDQMRKIGQIK